MSGRYPESRISLNTNNSNSAQRGTTLLPVKFARSKETHRSGQSSRPPPEYQTPPPPAIVDWSGSGSIPPSPRERRREGKPRSQQSSSGLHRSQSVDRLKDPTSTMHTDFFATREGQKSCGGSQYADSSRERYKRTPGDTLALADGLTVTEKQARERSKSPRLNRSQSFSLIGSNSDQRTEQVLLAKRPGAGSKTHSRPMFPTTISPTCTTEPSTTSRTNRPAYYDNGSRTSLEPAYDVNRYSHVPSDPRPRSRSTTTSPSGGSTRPVISSPAPPHTSALGQSLKSRNTSTGSLPVGTVPHNYMVLGTSQLVQRALQPRIHTQIYQLRHTILGILQLPLTREVPHHIGVNHHWMKVTPTVQQTAHLVAHPHPLLDNVT
ncbi:hypothetical protein GBAR_LOCUS27401 [Geodia barretti]|uniref:Uncharacterized protein n=1 Tax=Geodia barretti TaxID=519541 RepID=A0AA35TMK0_GEOBA|nr:hypothetical protein GBAR_LOCUS27401 [Geodia barretti]